MKRISVAHRFKDRALVASLVRGIAFALITLLFTTVAFFKGFLWCIYIGFSLTMAFGAKKCEYKNIPADYAENLVWEGCLNYINNPDIALEEIDKSIRASKESSINTESEIIMLTSSLYSKESEKESILDLYRRKIIDSKDVENQLLNIQQEKNRIEDKINELKNKKEILINL